MLEVTNLTKTKIDKGSLEKIVRKTCDMAGDGNIKDISIVFLDEEAIKDINKQYRNKSKATDVLSFEELNEVLICPGVVREQAAEFKTSFDCELMRVAVHGILHLLGFDHMDKRDEVRMISMEKAIINELGRGNLKCKNQSVK